MGKPTERYYNIYYECDGPKGRENSIWSFLGEDELNEVLDGLQHDVYGKNAKVIEIEVKSYGKRL